MEFKELMESPLLLTPIVRDDKHFVEFLKNFYQSYEELIESYSGEFDSFKSECLPVIKQLNKTLLESISEYYLGNTAKSYERFETAMESIRKYLLIQTEKPSELDYFEQECYFKIRQGYWKRYTKKEMFHRSFTDREFIPTYRYSIPGFPCLYLSNNIKTAWQELGKPDINSMQISRFELSKDLKSLFFSMTVDAYTTFFAQGEKLSKEQARVVWDYLCYFTFQASCSIIVKHSDAVFKPEYIFPQFLMQWIRKSNIDMIRFMSTKVERNGNKFFAGWANTNVAIPAQTDQVEGYCSNLIGKIKLTEPVSWQELSASYLKSEFPKTDKKPSLVQSLKGSITGLELIPGHQVLYKDTVFGVLENFLELHMTADYLTK